MKTKLGFYRLFILLFPLLGLAQPSYQAEVSFRFYNKSKEVSKEMMSKDYKLFDYSFGRFNPSRYRYQDSNKTYTATGGIVYNDFRLLIVHQKDTMQLIFKTKESRRLNFKIQRLDFHEGVFVIDSDSMAQLDIKKSKSNYYNHILSQLPQNTSYFEENPIYKELKKLKLKYGIQEDDSNPKTEKELKAISSLKDSLILKKYQNFLSASNYGEHDMTHDGKLYYAPDKKFKIFVYHGESCGGNCMNFYNSFLHFNLNKKEPTALETNFNPVDSIIKLNKDNYLVFHSGVEGGGIYVYEYKNVTLVQLKENDIIIGDATNFPKELPKGKIRDIHISRDALTDGDEEFYLKYDRKTNILEYKYWEYLDDDRVKKVGFSGKLIFSEDHFAVLSQSRKLLP